MPIIRSWVLTRGFALHPGTSNRYMMRYTRTQHRPASPQVNDHGRVSGTHTLVEECADPRTGEIVPLVVVTDNGPAMKSVPTRPNTQPNPPRNEQNS